MPVSSVDVRDGDPTIQASGQYRGSVDVTMDDGRVFTLNIRAPDQDSWNDQVAAAGATIQARVEVQDAEAAVTPDADVAANKEASIAQTCIAYIRRAWEEQRAKDASDLYTRINNFVTANGGWAVAKPALLAAGLPEAEYDRAEAAYQYFAGGGRQAILADAETIQQTWESQH